MKGHTVKKFLSIKSKKITYAELQEMKIIQVVAAIILFDGKGLCVQRASNKRDLQRLSQKSTVI